jgi:hypothetical protein
MGSRDGHVPAESVQDALAIAAIGDGYVLRNDGIAVGLAEITPPDLRLHDDTSLAMLLDNYETVLRSSGERSMLCTYAVPADIRPLLVILATAQGRASDFVSWTVLTALTDVLTGARRALARIPTVRWVLAVPSVAPEIPPRGTWGELYPSAIVGKTTRLQGDPVTEALARTRRLASALAALGTEPPPQLLSAQAIRALLFQALDPIRAQTQSLILADTLRFVQTHPSEPVAAL